MDTREAIKFVEYEIKCLEKEIEICNSDDDIDIQIIPANKKLIIKYNQVISLLQQGEKYRQMWEELEEFREILVTAECFISKYGRESLGMKMYKLKQKYFPKEEAKQDKESQQTEN